MGDKKKRLWLILALAVTLALIVGVLALRSCKSDVTELDTTPVGQTTDDTAAGGEPIYSNPVETYVEPADTDEE
jgi:cytochrome c-type biogenesis protein CcmE